MLFLIITTNMVYATDTISILMAGDTMLGENLNKIDKKIFGNVLNELKVAHDIKLFNLEGTIGDIKQNDIFPKCSYGKYCYTFMTPPSMLSLFKDMQTNSHIVFNMANNHSMDYGIKVQEKTYDLIIKENFGAIGTRKNPIIKYNIRNHKIALLGASPHSNTFSIFDQTLLSKISFLKKQGYIIIVSLHMGAEGNDKYKVIDEDEIFLGQNRGNIYKLSRSLIDNGADLIVGHGPHVLRGIEMYKNKIVAYSLGNFLTYGKFALHDKLAYGGLLSITLNSDGNFVKGKFIGVEQLKNTNPHEWNMGIALTKSKKSTEWLQKISYDNFNKNSIKFDKEGNLYK